MSKAELWERLQTFMGNHPSGIFNYKDVAERIQAHSMGMKRQISEVLREMAEKGVLDEVSTGRYKYRQHGSYITGEVELTAKGAAYIISDEMEEDVFVPFSNLKHALNGDKVKVLVYARSRDRRPEGEVVEILERKRGTFVGTVQCLPGYAFLLPSGKQMPYDVFLPVERLHGAKDGDKVVVKIVSWPENQKNPVGEVIEVLGRPGDNDTEMNAIMAEYELPVKFPPTVERAADRIPLEIPAEELKKRKDYREVMTFTIDPADAKDFDDALSVRELRTGLYEVGVHIADVSHYVKEGSKLDQEAILRGTSIYMMDRVIPMLPRELSNGICSLNAGTDRFAISVWMEVNEKGKVISSDVKKSVIHVTERMNYTDVTKILDRSDEAVLKRYEPYIEHFDRMKELAEILMERRKKEGSLDLDLPESKIILNQDGIAIDVQKEELTIANKIIEQFMLLANETIAERFYWLEAPFIYRVHEVPDMDKIEELNKFLYNFGYKIKATKEQVYPKAFADVLEKIKGKPEERVISNLILRTLKIAKYESENKGHFGIASKYYCHFTSPIRRYPDLFIHRIISMYLENPKQMNEVKKKIYRSQAVRYAETSSEREKIAQKVEREAIQIKMAEYMQDKVGEEYDGIISSITSFGMFVELENTVEGLIRFENLGEDYYIYDENRKTLFGERTKTIFKIGDSIRIRVIRANKELREIDFERVIPEEKQEEKDEIVD